MFLILQQKEVFEDSLNTFEVMEFSPGQCEEKN